jgi:hypothetical protein
VFQGGQEHRTLLLARVGAGQHDLGRLAVAEVDRYVRGASVADAVETFLDSLGAATPAARYVTGNANCVSG